MPRQRTVGRRQHAALRQFRHFLLIIGGELVATGNIARRARQRIGKDAADLRARGRRKRTAVAANKVARPVRAMVRSISRL